MEQNITLSIPAAKETTREPLYPRFFPHFFFLALREGVYIHTRIPAYRSTAIKYTRIQRMLMLRHLRKQYLRPSDREVRIAIDA